MEVTSGNFKFNTFSPEELRARLSGGNYPFRVALYGNSGSGKSRMADTFPGRKLVLDFDCGGLVYSSPDTAIVQLAPDSALAPKQRTAWEEANIVINWAIAKTDQPFDVLIVDSFTKMQAACMFCILKQAGHAGVQPTQPEYGANKRLCMEFIYKCFASGKHVIFTFHEQTDREELTGVVWCRPGTIGKLSQSLPLEFDEVYRLDPMPSNDTTAYRVLTRATHIYTAKSRLDSQLSIKLEQYEPADFKVILDKVKQIAGGVAKEVTK